VVLLDHRLDAVERAETLREEEVGDDVPRRPVLVGGCSRSSPGSLETSARSTSGVDSRMSIAACCVSIFIAALVSPGCGK
jgi:hypothetical protein